MQAAWVEGNVRMRRGRQKPQVSSLDVHHQGQCLEHTSVTEATWDHVSTDM